MLNKKLPAGFVRKPGEEETFACFTEEDVTSLTTAASLVALALEAHAEQLQEGRKHFRWRPGRREAREFMATYGSAV